ncbi:MAG TPA: Clp protease N-terminal domain-containing protein, partial [Terriglobia bacterium]|nr:Clp protease N-terminal domain-containing protein [Terriglobia bacterium]
SRIPTSVDLPLSDECKRILGFAAEESESLGHSYIGTEHLLLGILRETTCRAAGLLMARGIRLEDFREEVRGTGEPKPVSMTPPRFAGEAGLAYWLRQSFDKESPIARGHLAKAMTCAGSKQWDEARSELQIFLDAMVEGISERPQGAEVLAPMIAGLDWKRAPSEIHTGLPDAEDFRFRLHFTLLLANLLHERRKRLEG